MDFQLGTKNLLEIGDMISYNLHKNGVSLPFKLEINVNGEYFRKIDEDLFYRSRVNENEEFTPSENKIIVNVDDGEIHIINSDATMDEY